MTTGVGTPIAVFSLGLGPLIGAGIQGVSAAIPAVTAGVEAATAAVPAITAGVEAATAVAPAIAAGVEGVAAAAPAIAAGVEGAAAAVPSLMAGVEAGATAAPALAEAAGVGGQSLVQGVAQGAPVVTESLTGALPGAQQAVATPASIMSQISGPQMSTQTASLPLEASWGANMSTSAGPQAVSAPTMPPSEALKAGGLRENDWVQRGGKALKSLGKSAAKQAVSGKQQSQPRTMGGAQYGTPSPPTPYTPRPAGHVSNQQQFSDDLMKDYLSSKGAFYG